MTEAHQVAVRFRTDTDEYTGHAAPGEIVHEVFQRVLPERLVAGHQLQFRSAAGDEVFADNFIRDLVGPDGEVTLRTISTPIAGRAGSWRNIGADHLALTVADRASARDFFRDVLQMQVMRDDAHLTVLATPMTGIFLFDAGIDAPMSDPTPSRFHHLGFVVDDLEAAYAHLRVHRDQFASDFALLERDERWSLYCHYRNGDVTMMIQLSEIKEGERGIASAADSATKMYDYARRPYGLVFPQDDEREG